MEPEMQYAIAKLHFRDPPSPNSLREGLIWVLAFQTPIYFDLCFSKDRADKVTKNYKLSKCPREDGADTWISNSALRYVRGGKALSWAFPRFVAI